MTATKRVLGDYTISTDGNINLGKPGPGPDYELDFVNIYGNLNVFGSTTSVSTSDTLIEDKVITLNAGELGPGVSSPGVSGLEVDRGPSQFKPTLRWNESISNWELTFDGVNWGTIITSYSGLKIELDKDPKLGGNLDVNGFLITSSNDGNIQLVADGFGQLILSTPPTFPHQTVEPSEIPNAARLYAKNQGDSGVYFVNNGKRDQLASRKRSIAYAFLF